MAGLCDRPRCTRETGRSRGKFAAVCTIFQWEMQVDSKLGMPLTRAPSAALMAFCGVRVYVLGFEKTRGSVSRLIALMDSSVRLLLILGSEFSMPAFIFLILVGKYWGRWN